MLFSGEGHVTAGGAPEQVPFARPAASHPAADLQPGRLRPRQAQPIRTFLT